MGGDCVGDNAADGAEHPQRDRSRDQDGQHRNQNGAQNRRNVLAQELFYIGHEDDCQHNRDDAGGIGSAGNGNAKEFNRFFAGQQTDQVWMNQNTADGHGNVLVALEVLCGAAGQQNRQEVIDGIREDHHEPVERGCGIYQTAEHEEQQNAFDQTGTDHCGEDRNENTGQRVHDDVQGFLFLCRCIHSRCLFLRRSFAHQCHKLLINVRHLAAEDHLILFPDQIDAHDTGQLFDFFAFDDRYILCNDAQTSDAMGHTGNIFFAADQVENLRGEFFVCHTMLLLNLSCLPSDQELFDVTPE